MTNPPDGPQKSPVDVWLKCMMPSNTVIRRYVMGSWLIKIVLVVIVIVVIEKQDNASVQRARAVCPIIDYAETQARSIGVGDPDAKPPRRPNPEAARNLEELARRMRATGIDCPPPPLRH